MKPHVECGACLVHWVYERAVPHASKDGTTRLTRGIVDVLLEKMSPSANLGALCNGTVYAASELAPAMAPHYEQLKAKSNEHARAVLPRALTYVLDAATARDAFERACFLAAAANVSPLGAPSEAYTFSEIEALMHEGSQPQTVGDVYGAAREAAHILYVTDNAGEIGFDAPVMLFLKAMGKRVTLVVKAKTFFEDATASDALFFGLGELVDEIVETRGFLVPGEAEPEVARAMARADMIIAKGTGAYEALKGEVGQKASLFMLKVKCPAIARETGLETGAVVVKLERGG